MSEGTAMERLHPNNALHVCTELNSMKHYHEESSLITAAAALHFLGQTLKKNDRQFLRDLLL
jgi:hypothetical protein